MVAEHTAENGMISVLYVEDDEEESESVRQFFEREHPDILLVSVGSMSAALETLAERSSGAFDCLLVEFAVVDGRDAIDRLRPDEETPVVLYTRVDVADMSMDTVEAADTIVQKGDAIHRRFLANKLRGVTADEESESRYEELASIVGEEDVAIVLLEDGQACWTSGLDDLFPMVPDASVHDRVAHHLVEEGYREQVAAVDPGEAVVGSLWTLARDGRRLACWNLPVDVGGPGERVLVFRDVTDDAERVEELDRLETLVELSDDALYTIDSDARYTSLNEATAEMLGYDRAELLGRYNPFTMAEGALRKGQRAVQQVIESDEETSDIVDQRHVTADGEEVVGAGHFGVIYREDGSYDGLSAVVRDITARKQREQRLRRYRRLVEQAQNPMYALDTDGCLSVVNDALAALLTEETLVGEPFDVVAGDEWARKHAEALDRLDESAEPATAEETFETELTVGESTQWFEVGVGHIYEDDEVVGSVGSMHDVTTLKEQEQELRARERDVRNKNEQLEAFADIVTHNLRNPHHIASSYLELARESDDPQDIQRVLDALDRMDRIIDNLLTYASINEVTVEREPVSLEATAQRIWNDLAADGTDGHVETAGDITVRADPELLAFAFETLFEGTIRYTDAHQPESPIVRVGPLPSRDGFLIEELKPGVIPGSKETTPRGGDLRGDETDFTIEVVERVATAHDWELTLRENDGMRLEITGLEGHP